MKKLLTATIAVVMGATLVGSLAACGSDTNDAETAKKAISTVRAMYLEKAKETPSDYQVIGKTKANDVWYNIDWTVTPAATCTIENFSNYVSVGEMDSENMVTVSISRTEMDIDYTLKASVTVGKATEFVEFERSVPKGKDFSGEEVQKGKLDFSDEANRTTITSDEQVWGQNGITFTNGKGSGTPIDVEKHYFNPVRLYKGSTVKIEFPGMAQILFTCNTNYSDNPYVDRLKESLEASLQGATITADVDSKTVTVVLTTPVDVLEFTASAGQIQLFAVEVTGYVGGATDAQKVAAAKAALDIEKNYVAAAEYDLPATQSGATVEWAVESGSEYVSIKEGKLSVDTMPTAKAEVTLKATIKSGNETDTKDVTISLIPIAGVTHTGTETNPFKPSEAKLVAKTILEVGATSTTLYYVQGYVIAPGTYSTQFKNFDNMYIADVYAADKATTADDALYVFRPTPDGTHLTTAGFTKGDLVTFKGYLQNYKADTQELVSGTCIARDAAKLTDADKVAEALSAIKATLANVTATGEVTLPTASTIDGVTISWKTEDTTYTVTDNKLNVETLPAEDATVTLTVTAKCGEAEDSKSVTVIIKAPKEATAKTGTFKLAMVHTNLDNKKLYFKGAMSGYYYGTTENVAEAADVVIAKVEGGYTLKTGDKYLEIEKSGTYINVKLNPTSSKGVWTYNSELGVFTWKIEEDEFFLGTDANKTYDTISAVNVTKFETSCVAEYEEVVPMGTLKLAMVHTNLDNKKLYFKGAMSGYYYGTTENVAEAADVVIAKVEGGYTLKTGDKYLEIEKSGTYINVKLNPTSSKGVWTYNSELGVFTWAIEEDVFFLGTDANKTYDTISAVNVTKFETSCVAIFEEATSTPETPAKEATSINFNDIELTDTITKSDGSTYEAKTYAADSKINDIFTLKGGAWEVDANNGTITDATGAEVKVTKRLKTNGKRTMEIDLSAYTGQVKLQFFVRTSSKNDLTRSVILTDSAEKELGKLVLSEDKIFTFEVTVDGGAVYTLSNPVNAVNFYGINVIPVANSSEENPPVPTGNSAKLDFSSITENGTAITDGDATELFANYCSDAKLTKVEVAKAYKGNGTGGNNYENQGGLLKFGTSKAGGSLKLTFSEKVTKVEIKCVGWSTSDKISVNGDEKTVGVDTNVEATTLSFGLTEAAQEITIEISKRALIFEIIVYFEAE